MFSPVIQVNRLTRYFGPHCVLRDLDMCVSPGQITALMGLNGAGKTTAIRIVMGLLRATRGRCAVFGEDPVGMSPDTRMRIGYLVEGHFLYRSMRVQDCPRFQRSGYTRWDERLFDQIIAHFGIRASSTIGQLSRGQRAGVALALVLAPDPELLVLDDPALGLDPISRRALNETLIEFAGDGKRTVLLSTHLLDDVERAADRVMVLVDGRLKVDASMSDFMGRVSGYAVEGDVVDTAVLSTIPGLIEARKIGDRYQLSVADAGEKAAAVMETLGARAVEETELTFSDSVLAYLAGQRRDSSFIGSERTGAV